MARSFSPPRPSSLVSMSSLCAFFFLYPSLAIAGDLPLVDFNRMGKVGLAGAFAGLDLFSNASSAALSFDPSTSTLLSRSPDGSLTRLGATNPGGSISASCALGDNLFVAGSFSSIGGVAATNIAAYASSSGAFSALAPGGPDADVHALFCDLAESKVWLGGRFASPAPGVAVYNVGSSLSGSSWSAPPFGGLAGPLTDVRSISTNSSQRSLFFAGSFVTAFGNATRPVNATNNPHLPFSAGATPFSSSLVPVFLGNAQIDQSPAQEPGFENITNILCPAGPDGANNTWFAQDGSKAVITVRKFAFLTAGGVRLGNTFLGRSSTAFSVTTIPDNAVRTLHYTDPTTGQNNTCTDPCPLLADPGVPYQDFLFDDNLDITGFQLTISEWTGDGPGLHLMQLLSSGAFASSIASQNGESCFSPGPSNTTQTGKWSEKDADTNIPGTVQAVLVSTVPVGTSPGQGSSFTWMPYVSASGVYNVSMLVPGCTNFQDCALRTSVQVSVFPGGGLPPQIQTVSQQNTEDAETLIYSGPVVPNSDTFAMTVTMQLADQPAGQGQDGNYELVADRISLVLLSPDINGTTTSGPTPGTAGFAQTGFGFFEWPLAATSGFNATSAIPEGSATALDSIGVELLSSLGGANAPTGNASVAAVAHHASGAIFLGGSFQLTAGAAPNSANIVVFKDGNLSALAGNGLNGPVTSLVVDGDNIFVGGAFTDTQAASTQGKLAGVAVYNVQQNQWAPLDAGVTGAVASLSLAQDVLLVAGNFTGVNSQSQEVDAGFAAWNTTSQVWVNAGGFLVGQMTFVGNGTLPAKGQQQGQVVAGRVATALQFGSPGFVMLQNGPDDVPEVTPLNVQLSSGASLSSPAKRSLGTHTHAHARRAPIGWIPKISNLFKRQNTASTLVPLPPPSPAIAPAVLAGAYWTNSSSGHEVVVLGGNFTFTSSTGTAGQNVAIFDPESGVLTALQGSQVSGPVRTLLVQGETLFVGGSFAVQGTQFEGFAVYNLAQQQWDATGAQGLQASAGAAVTVRTITASPSQENKLVVAGSFAQAGSVPCRAVCLYDIPSKSWSALGNGVQGEAAAVAYAGNSRDVIVIAGSLALADGTGANVAEFSVTNSTWSAVGGSSELPGPVTAVEVNNGNASSIFAAGKTTDGTGSFLSFWNGQSWTSVGSAFQGSTEVAQLTMVPLQNTHSGNSIIEPDRMLWISGSLSDSAFGNASAALFDGQQIIPYIMTSSSSGSPGTLSALVHSFSTFSFTQRHFLAVGIVILISIAIAAGVVFLLALIGILWAIFARKEEKIERYDPAEDDDDSTTHRPSSLLEHINAATRTTILGQSPFAANESEKEAESHSRTVESADPFGPGPDASNYLRADTPSDAMGGLASAEDTRPAHARYSFDGQGEGELSLFAGQEIDILDDGDAAWWYARDPRTGREGVVPAAYVY